MHRILLGLAAAAALTMGATTDASAQGISIGFSTGYGGWGGHAYHGSRWGHHHHRLHHVGHHGLRLHRYRAPVIYGLGYGYSRGIARPHGGYSNPYVTRRYATPRYRVCPYTGRHIPY